MMHAQASAFLTARPSSGFSRGVANVRHRHLLGTIGYGEIEMTDETTIIAGIPVPSTSPLFLAGVAVHVLLGLACVARRY